MNRFILGVIALLVTTLTVYAMPPSFETISLMKSNGTWESYLTELRTARQQGVDSPCTNPLNQLRAHRRDGADQITLHIPVILVDFSDKEANQQQFSSDHFREILFGQGNSSMREFYLENSYDEVEVVGEVFGWYRMEQSYAHYVGNNHGFSGGGELARDACVAANGDADFTRYDNDGDGVVEAVIVVHAGAGAEATGSDGDIWSHASSFRAALDGVNFKRYSLNPENGAVGVFGHEIGHALFGLPDLYDYDYSSNGLGVWSMMAFGSWSGPSHLDAWCKYKLGFIHPQVVDRNHEGVRIAPIETADQTFLFTVPRNGQPEYFLVENRQKIGFDRQLPGAGLLIYHVDTNQGGVYGANNNEWYPGLGSDHYLVAVEQADGLWDIEHRHDYGDDGDPFPGVVQNTDFTDQSIPNARGYQNNRSHTWITGIQLEGQEVICNILNGLNAQNVVIDSMNLNPQRVNPGRQVTLSYKYANDGNLTSSQTVIRTYLSADARYSRDDAVLGDDVIVGRLASGEVTYLNKVLNIPQGTNPGGYYILALADPDSQLVEITKGDNLCTTRLLVGTGPNLRPDRFVATPAFIRPSQQFEITYQISNNGGETADSYYLDFYFSRDTIKSNDDLSLGARVEEDELASAAIVQKTISRTLPAVVTPGYCYVLAILDRQNHVREIDETDNKTYTSFTIPGPNIEVIYATASVTDLEPQMETELDVWFSNTGIMDAGVSSVGVALSHDPILSNDDWTLGDIPMIDSLALGDTLHATYRRTMPPDVWTGNWYLLVKCDCIGRIAELNEDDNVYAIPISVVSEDVRMSDEASPRQFRVVSTYPNPTNGDATIEFDLPAQQNVQLKLVSETGAVVAVIANQEFGAGRTRLMCPVAGLPTGVYFIRAESGSLVFASKLILIR